jgi:hypothetical protein
MSEMITFSYECKRCKIENQLQKEDLKDQIIKDTCKLCGKVQIVEKYTKMKTCPKCLRTLGYVHFRKNKGYLASYCKQCERQFFKEYNQSDTRKKYMKEYSQSEACKEYSQSEACKKAKKRYSQSEAYEKAQKKYQQSAACKEYQKQYRQSEAFKEAHKEYQKKYRQSEAYKESKKKYRLKKKAEAKNE